MSELVVAVTVREVSTAHTGCDHVEVVSARNHDGSRRQASASCMLEASHTATSTLCRYVGHAVDGLSMTLTMTC